MRTTHSDTAAPRRSARRRWFDVHGWVGLKLSLLMLFVCATGTLAVLSHEIDWLIHPPMRVAPRDAVHASWGEQLAAVRAAYPDWQVQALRAPIDPWFAAVASVRTDEGRLRFVWVDPYTATVQGDTHWFNVARFLRNTHRHLMLPVKIGVSIVGPLGVAMLVSFATSLVVYRRWWRGFFAWPRRERARRFWGDVHRLAGVWSLWFVLLIGATGTWYLVENWGGAAAPLPDVGRAYGSKGESPVVDIGAIDRAARAAEAAIPGFEIVTLWPPDENGRVLFEGDADAVLVRERANAVTVDLADGRVVATRVGADLGVHQRIAEMADPLHFGTFGGLATKLVWFVFGALLTALSATGVYLYGLRVAASLRGRTRADEAGA